MKQFFNVKNNILPQTKVFDDTGVWLTSDVIEEKQINILTNEETIMYSYTLTLYTKDEYIRKIESDLQYLAMMCDVDLDTGTSEPEVLNAEEEPILNIDPSEESEQPENLEGSITDEQEV